MTTNYVDCSSNNGTPDVAAYADAGHRKLSVKTSEGTSYHWYQGEGVARTAHAHGLAVEYYHWLRPDSSARAQADYFVRLVGKTWQANDNLMTDFERTYDAGDPGDAQRADQLAEFNERVTTLLARPRLYTGNWYLDGKPHMQAECRRWDVVMSDYSGVETLPNPYGLTYVAWQFTSTARVAGFGGTVDYNRPIGDQHTAEHASAVPTPEVTSMFEIIQRSNDGIWYAWAPGYWRRLFSVADIETAARSHLCVNGAAVRGGLAAKNDKARAKFEPGYVRAPSSTAQLRALALNTPEAGK